jgi:hypothetical protein
MLGGPETEVFHLKTYPVMKRVAVLEGVTNTIVARRSNCDASFVSVLETYVDRPVARSIEALPCDIPGAVALRLTTRVGTRLLLYNPDPARPLTATVDRQPVRLDGHFAVIRLAGDGMVAGMVLVDGSRLELGGSTFRTATPANLCLKRAPHKPFSATASADLAFETLDGEPVHAACGEVRLVVTTGGRERAYLARAPSGTSPVRERFTVPSR